MGDLNARTGTTPEYTEFNIDNVTFQKYNIDNDVMNYLNNGNELQTHNISRVRTSCDGVKITLETNYSKYAAGITYIFVMAEWMAIQRVIILSIGLNNIYFKARIKLHR